MSPSACWPLAKSKQDELQPKETTLTSSTRLTRRAALWAAATVALGIFGAAQAQETYPSKPITIVIPSAAGTGQDAVARLIGQELTKAWNQPVIVDNKPGAGTTIGTRFVARAPKDGYTALLTFTAHVQNATFFPQRGYDPVKDFAGVSKVAVSTTVLVVSPDFPGRTVKEVVAYIKANPGKIFYGTYGAGTTGHIYGELFKREAGLDMQPVHYKGGAPLATDLVGGQVKVGLIAVGSALPLLRSGRLIPVAVAGSQRSKLLPNVPTLGDAGYKGFDLDAWMALLVPAGTPRDRVHALSAEVGRILKMPQVAQKIEELAFDPSGGTPEEMDRLLAEDLTRWTGLITQFDIKPE
jgi:tripartite-type tricarboxylate transporter receptor subunit TctC